jgi:hypothetical protein
VAPDGQHLVRGRRIVVQVAPVDTATGVPDAPEIWMITFPEPQ